MLLTVHRDDWPQWARSCVACRIHFNTVVDLGNLDPLSDEAAQLMADVHQRNHTQAPAATTTTHGGAA